MEDENEKNETPNGRFPNVPTKRIEQATEENLTRLIRRVSADTRVPLEVAADAAIAAIFTIHAGGTLGDLARAIAESIGADPTETVALLDDRLKDLPMDPE